MAAKKTKWLLAGLRWLIVGPGVGHAQPPDLLNAFERCSDLYSQGHYREALRFTEKALRRETQVFGRDQTSSATPLDNLEMFHRVQGHCAAAEPLYQRPLTISDKSPGFRRSISAGMGR